MAFVKLSDLTIQYQSYDSKVAWPPTIDHLSATFESGTLTLLTGPSGSGKSTLLKTIAGLYPKFGEASVSGSVTIETSSTQPRVAMMFQDPNQQFAMDTVERELRFALENLQVEADKIDDQVQAALDYVGISNLRHRQLNNLSGGEKQKVALAIIVAMDSEVILLDEPFASIDPAARQTLLIKLRQLNQKAHKTVIIADHDLLNYEPYVDGLVRLSDDGHQLRFFDRDAAHDVFEAFKNSAQLDISVTLPQPNEPTAVTLNQTSLIAGDRTLLKPTSFTFPEHRVILLTGINGSGKSTLLRAITNLSNYIGDITVAGVSTSRFHKNQRYQQVGLVFQEVDDQFLNVTVAEELALSLKHSRHPEYFQARLDDDLNNLGLADLREHVVYSLSGGQKKKLQILIMLIMATPILLLDEPFTGLDLQSLNTVVALVKDVQQAFKLTLIMISHQLQGLAPLIDYHAVLANQTLTYVEAIR